MKELITIYPKTVFRTFLVLFETGRSVLGYKRCREGFPDVSGTDWKNSPLNPEEMTIFPHLALFFHLSLPKI